MTTLLQKDRYSSKNSHLMAWIAKAAGEELRCGRITQEEYDDVVGGTRVIVDIRRHDGTRKAIKVRKPAVLQNDRLLAAWDVTKELLRRLASNHFFLLEQKGQSVSAWEREVREMGLTFSYRTLYSFRGGYARHRSVQLSWVVLLAMYWDMPAEELLGRDFVMEAAIARDK